MKRIGIDCRFAGTSTGLGRYSRELVTHLLRRQDPAEYVLFVRSETEEWIWHLPKSVEVIPVSASHYTLREQILLPSLIRRAKLDLFFALHFNVPFFCTVPAVFTLHDLILHRFPNNASPLKQTAYRILLSRAVRKARHIITVSDFTRQELAHFYGRSILTKTTTVYEGVSSDFTRRSESEQQRIRELYQLHKPFFVYVGNAKQHKNVQMLIDAFASLRRDDRELVLICGGKECSTLKLSSGVRFIETVDDADLPALYSAALALVTASLYEGFGLPIAEAEQCGCPVIAAARGSIPEIAPKNALLIEPTVQTFAAAMSRFEFPSSAPRLWSWEKAAEKTAEILLISGKKHDVQNSTYEK